MCWITLTTRITWTTWISIWTLGLSNPSGTNDQSGPSHPNDPSGPRGPSDYNGPISPSDPKMALVIQAKWS